MVVFPNAKINLGLHITGKRPDGYHELETCFYPVPWTDALEIVESRKTEFFSTGISIPDDGDNIVMKAYQLLAETYDLPPVKAHLHKVIPIGAGLGGGSSDAAFTIRLLNELFELQISDTKMKQFAVGLGADCAFFIDNQPSMAYGIGEKLRPIDMSLEGKFIVLTYPDLHISTKVAFAGIVPQKPTKSIEEILIQQPVDSWKLNLVNDFEKSVFAQFPELQELKNKLYNEGAMYASMSGSGSCIFGIFERETEIDVPSNYLSWSNVL
jgi:4-diphosphocytidyl-2-C-methyl-D-erythritol kinase